MSLPDTARIAIVGAGLLGRLLSWQLSRTGYDTTIFEANSLSAPSHELDAAAFTAAGMIAPISESVEDDIQIYHLGMTSLAMWPSIIEALNRRTDTPIMYQHSGSVVICHPQDSAELFHFRRKVEQLVARAGAQYTLLDRAAIASLEPDIHNSISEGLLLPEEGQLDNGALLTELLAQGAQHGDKIFDGLPVSIENDTVVRAGQRHRFDLVLDCRGFGAKTQLAGLRGVRGEVLTVESREVELQRPVRLMHPRYQLYIAPKKANQFVIGATQIESEDQSPFSVQSMLELCSALYSVNPAFAEARITHQSTNLRPALSDNMPRIMQRDKHISINGLFRHGYLLAPAVCQCLIDHLNRQPNHHHDFLYRQQEH
ncbi:MAG: FAD-dependent oxidoreductase [Pseudomonadales bacterium]